MTKTVCILLSVLLLMSVLVSCDSGNNPPPSETSATDTTTAPETDISETVGNIADYVIVRNFNAPSTVADAVVYFRTLLKSTYNIQLKTVTDKSSQDEQPDPDKKEILIGLSGRNETNEVMSSLPYGAYAIRVLGNKIVITAYSADKLNLAIEHFISQCMANKGDIVTVTSEFTSESAPDLFTAQNPLEKYTLVYDKSNPIHAGLVSSVSERLETQFGIKLPQKDISDAPTENEFIISTEGRDEVAAALAAVGKYGYTVRPVGNKLIVAGCDTVALTFAVDSLISEILDLACTNIFNLPTDTAIDGSLMNEYTEGGDDTARAEGTNLRIMTFNILSEWWNDKLPIAGRDTVVLATLHAYQPDIAGLEETTPNWLKAIQAGLVPGYKTSSGKMADGTNMNVNVLVYNSETVELLEEGVIPYSNAIERKADYIRNLTWGRFRRLSDGAEFIVTVTHWDTDATARAEHAVEHARFIDELEKKYGCPIITTGDYNASETKDEFKNYLALTGFQNARFDAEICNRQQYQTSHKVGSAPNKGGSIDNITASADVKFKYYNVLTFPKVLEASDHCPVYVDAILK